MKQIALELIDYQNNDKFPERLTNIIENIYRDIDNKIYKSNNELIAKSEDIKRIEKLIKERFNLTVIIDKELGDYYVAAIIPFLSDYLTEFNLLKNLDFSIFRLGLIDIYRHLRELEKEREEYFKRIHNRRGYIDLKYARVSGYLADVKHYLLISFFSLKDMGLTPREITAVILHEIGHAFVGLETHHRITTTNSTIMDILDSINKNKKDKALYIFKRYFKKEDIDEGALGTNKEITDFYGKLAEVYLDELQSHLIRGKYDETNYENLADSFANRFNLGRDLVSGLHKVHLLHNVVFPKSKFVYYSLLLLDFIENVLLLIMSGPTGVILMVFIIIFVYGHDYNHMTYDFPIDRYNRIKNGIINNLKNTNLPKALMKDLLEQYMFIDKVIKDSDYFKGILPTIADYILPSNRNNNYYIHLQQTIENSLNNTLFVSSAKLRTL